MGGTPNDRQCFDIVRIGSQDGFLIAHRGQDFVRFLKEDGKEFGINDVMRRLGKFKRRR